MDLNDKWQDYGMITPGDIPFVQYTTGQGKTILIPLHPVAKVGTFHLTAAKAIKGDRKITINGQKYRVRLMTGGSSCKTPAYDEKYIDEQGLGGNPSNEYDEYIINTLGQQAINWISDGRHGIMCQEFVDNRHSVCRGLWRFDGWATVDFSFHDNIMGWWPVLELVQ